MLDPFCGSGTVLVEGMLAGARVAGVDANPLAIELSWLKTRRTTAQERAAILHAAYRVSDFAEERRTRRSGATRRYAHADVALFDPHVLLELDGLKAGISEVRDRVLERTLFLVLSSMLVKVSRRPGDTADRRTERRLASGFTIRLFRQKTEELLRRMELFGSALPGQPKTEPLLRLGDARRLEGIATSSVALVVTSPPYPGNYDYLAHHELRLRWLGLDPSDFAETELGARRHLGNLSDEAARARWSADLGAVLSSIARVSSPEGRAVLILADSVIHRRALYADQLVRQLAGPAGLLVTAIASQARPHFHAATAGAFGPKPRREHAICLRKAEPARRR